MLVVKKIYKSMFIPQNLRIEARNNLIISDIFGLLKLEIVISYFNRFFVSFKINLISRDKSYHFLK